MLSTANYKALDRGVTNLDWRQRFNGGRQAILVGHLYADRIAAGRSASTAECRRSYEAGSSLYSCPRI